MKTQIHFLKLIVSFIALVFSTVCFAQQGINYQGVARDANNEVLVSIEIDLEINVNKASADGTTVYNETHTVFTDANGVFSIVIGQGTTAQNFENDINWAEDKHFLNVWLNGAEIGTTEFMSVPYTQAIGKWQAHKNGLTAMGTGGSFYIGDNAGENDDFMDNHNIGIGQNALQNSSSFHNIAIGKEALMNNDTGWNNVALGPITLTNNIDGNYNLALGVSALYNNTSGSYNLAFGSSSLRENTTGDHNLALGRSALYYNESGEYNIALGYKSLNSNTVGNHNIAHGEEALFANRDGSYNLAIGNQSLFSNTLGEKNIALGLQALYTNTLGSDNIAIGEQSLNNLVDGNQNIAIGKGAMYNNVDGSVNTAVGLSALRLNQSGNFNTAIGAASLRNNTSGIYNTVIGASAGFLSQGNRNVFIGLNSGFEEQGDNKLYIENTSTDAPLIYGEFDNDIIAFNAKVGIGTQTPQVPLQITTGSDVDLSLGSGVVVLGDELGANLALDSNEIQARNGGVASSLYLQQNGGNVYVGNAIVHSSDRRLKRDIKSISYGLSEILKLQPTEYFWKGKAQDEKSLGLIAQDVEHVISNVVTYNKEQDRYGVSYTELVPVLIKAIQEQQIIIKMQQKRNIRQSKDLGDLKDRMDTLETLLSKIDTSQF